MRRAPTSPLYYYQVSHLFVRRSHSIAPSFFPRFFQGGENLAHDRRNLPQIEIDGPYGPEYVRCPTGSSVITGPNRYGDLQTPYVVHAVGPNYWDFCGNNEDDSMSDSDNDDDDNEENKNNDNEAGISKANDLLISAYQTSLDLAVQHQITEIAFSLLSAGVYRGPLPREMVLRMAVQAIEGWATANEEATKKKEEEGKEEDMKNKNTDDDDKKKTCSSSTCDLVMEVTLCAFNAKECETLQRICDEKFNKNSHLDDDNKSSSSPKKRSRAADDDNNNKKSDEQKEKNDEQRKE